MPEDRSNLIARVNARDRRVAAKALEQSPTNYVWRFRCPNKFPIGFRSRLADFVYAPKLTLSRSAPERPALV